MANITKISVNGEVYDINPAWVSVTDGGLVLNIDKVREVTMRSLASDPVDQVHGPGLALDNGAGGKVTLIYNEDEHKLNIFDNNGYRVSIPLTNSGGTDTSGTSGTSSPATDTSSTTSSTTTPAP